MASQILKRGVNNSMGIGLSPRPGDPYSTTASTGIGNLTPSLADQAFGNSGTYNLGTPSSLQDLRNEEKKLLGDFDKAAPTIKAPPPAPRRPMIAFNRASGRLSVNGFEFDSDDYASAVQSQQYLNAPSQRPKGANWDSLSARQYEDYLSRITNPTLGTRFKRSFEIGTQGLKTLAGAGLQFAGAEDFGSELVQSSQERIQELSPFQATAAEVADGELGAIEYAVSMIGQQGPNIIESIAAGLIGFAVGGATSGNPLGAALGSVGGIMSKAGFKKVAIEAAEVYAKKGLKGLDAKQRRALAQLGGVGAATAINNYVIGTADVYGEMRDRGAEAGDDKARAAAAALGIPYAILSTIPEAIGASRLLGLSGGGLIRRVGKGIAGGAVLEGGTEALQEGVVMAGGSQYGDDPYTNDEATARLIESAIAGATVGGAIGGVVNIRKSTDRNEPVNILDGPPVEDYQTQDSLDLEGGEGTAPRAGLRTNFVGEQGEFFGDDVDLGTRPDQDIQEDQPDLFSYDRDAPTRAGFGPAPDPQGDLFGNDVDLGTAPPPTTLDTSVQNVPMSTRVLTEEERIRRYNAGQLGTLPGIVLPAVRGPLNQAESEADPDLPRIYEGPPQQMELTGFEASFEEGEQLRDNARFSQAGPTGPTTESQLAGQLNPVKQAMADKAEAKRQRDADFDAAERQRTKSETAKNLTIDDYNEGVAAWDTFSDEAGKLLNNVTLNSRSLKAQEEWVRAVIGTGASKSLFNKLRKQKQKDGDEPLVRAPTEAGGSTTKSKFKKGAQRIALLSDSEIPVTIVTGDAVTTTVQGQETEAFILVRNEIDGVEGFVPLASVLDKRWPKGFKPEKPKEPKKSTPKKDRAAAADKAQTDEKAKPSQSQEPETKSQPDETKLPEGTASGPLKLFRSGKVEAPDGFMYLASNKAAATGGAKLKTLTQIDVNFANMLTVKSRTKLAELFSKGNDKSYADAARKEGYDAIAIQRNMQGKDPWIEYFDLNPKVDDDAVQKRSTTSVDDGKQAGPRKEDGDGDAQKENTTGKGRAKTKAETKKEPADKLKRKALAAPLSKEAGVVFDDVVAELFDTDQSGNLLETIPTVDTIDSKTVAKINKIVADKKSNAAAKQKAVKKVLLDAPLRKSSFKEEAIGSLSVDKLTQFIDTAQKQNIKYYGALDRLLRLAFVENDVNARTKARKAIATYSDELNGKAQFQLILFQIASDVDSIPVMKPEGKTFSKTEINPFYKLLADNDLVGPLRLDNSSRFNETNAPADIADLLSSPPTDRDEYFINNRMDAILKEEGIKDKTQTDQSLSDLADGTSLDLEINVDQGRAKLIDADTGKAPKAMSNGRVMMLARAFISKLESKPKLHVYRNQADLKTKNPRLYKAAVKSRAKGDFDTAPAVGFAFDNTAIIFSDRVANAQHLNFVLAHETLGHFGLRSVVPAAQFNTIMESIYDSNAQVRAAVDNSMEVKRDGVAKQSKAEAVEEYLADYAAVLDTNIISRVWMAIKRFLNKFAKIKFGDEDVRYLLDQSRKYVRLGGGPVIMSEVANRYNQVTTSTGPASNGRFSVATPLRDSQIAFAAGQMQPNMYNSWESVLDRTNVFVGKGGSMRQKWRSFVTNFLSLSTFNARENAGIQAMNNLFERHGQKASEVRIKGNETMAVALDRAIKNIAGSISTEQTKTLNTMLYDSQLKSVYELRELGGIEKFKAPLFKVVNGKVTQNEQLINQLKSLGRRSLKELRDGYTYVEIVSEAGKKDVKRTVKVKGIKGLTENSVEWIAYQQTRKAMEDVEIEFLRAKYVAQLDEEQSAIEQFEGMLRPSEKFTPQDAALLKNLIKTMSTLYRENETIKDGKTTLDKQATKNAENFAQAVNRFLIGAKPMELPVDPKKPDGEQKIVTVDSFFKDGTGKDMLAQLKTFRDRTSKSAGQFEFQTKLRQVMLSEYAATVESDKFTKVTLASGYVPYLRSGKFQLRVRASLGNQILSVDDSYKDQFVYMQFDTEREAASAAKAYNELFKNEKVTLEALDPTGEKLGYQRIEGVKLTATVSAVSDTISAPMELNLNEFIMGIERFGINLPPEKMKQVITQLTNQNASARKRLQRNFTPGADLDAVLAVAQHIDRRASAVAKALYRTKVNDLLNLSRRQSNDLWRMDSSRVKQKLASLKDRATNPQLSQDERRDAVREYEQMQMQYNKTNVVIDGEVSNRGDEFYRQGIKGFEFLHSNRDVSQSDIESGKYASRIRSATGLFQLGGSIATGLLNPIGMYVNGLPFLASYNAKTNFGGGFGATAATYELNRAVASVGLKGTFKMPSNEAYNSASFYENLAKKMEKDNRPATYADPESGLTIDEAKFIAKEIREGVMIPAQGNAMMGLSRGTTGPFNTAYQKFADVFMVAFTRSEQASRRSLGLAAYRLELQRLKDVKASGDIKQKARNFAVSAINQTMGEYSVMNRPAFFRSGIQAFVYMYKVYPVTSIQTFANLSIAGKLGMLALLYTLAGAGGFPLAEDLEDLIDTMLQMVGWKASMGSSRVWLTTQLDEQLFEGAGSLLMDGPLKEWIPIDLAGRVSLSNVIPGTSVLIEGADVMQEVKDIAGPIAGFSLDTLKFGRLVVTAPFSSTVSGIDALRAAPTTLLRNVGDVYSYYQNGAVVDKRGYVVSNEMSAALAIGRLAGFYPRSAAKEYTTIKYARRVSDYSKAVSAAYRTAWVKADAAGRRKLEREVREHNRLYRGTPMYISNFQRKVREALKEAKKTASQRTLDASARAGRDYLENFYDALGAEL